MSDFSKTSGEIVSKEQHKQWVDTYLSSAGEGAPRSEFFGKRFLKELMRQCKGNSSGVWIDYGRDVNGLRLVVVPADKEGKRLDIPIELNGLKDGAPQNGGGGSSTRCPNSCP